jgi:hypothetical protein
MNTLPETEHPAAVVDRGHAATPGASRFRLWAVLGLVALGVPLREMVLPAQVLLVAALLLLDVLAPAWYRDRAPAWVRRPRLAVIASVVLGLTALLAGWKQGNLLWLAAGGVLAWDAHRSGAWTGVVREMVREARASEEAPLAESGVRGGSTRAIAWTVGLFAGALLLGNAGGGMPSAPWIGLAWVAAVALLAVESWFPQLAARLPHPWLRRPALGAWASVVFAGFATAVASWTPSSLLVTAATLVFVRDAAARGELGSFDPRLLWHGWPRRLLTAGALLAMMTLTSEGWDNRYSTPGYSRSSSSTRTEYRSDGDYEVTRTTTEWVPGWSGGGDLTAEASWPGWLLLASLVWAAQRRRPSALGPMRWFPAGVAGVLSVWALNEMRENRAYAEEVRGGSGYVLEGSTPQVFTMCLFLFGAGALLLALRSRPEPVPVPPR